MERVSIFPRNGSGFDFPVRPCMAITSPVAGQSAATISWKPSCDMGELASFSLSFSSPSSSFDRGLSVFHKNDGVSESGRRRPAASCSWDCSGWLGKESWSCFWGCSLSDVRQDSPSAASGLMAERFRARKLSILRQLLRWRELGNRSYP